MCASVNMKDFASMHHEMAHVQYFLSYKDQPKVFREGANPGKLDFPSDYLQVLHE